MLAARAPILGLFGLLLIALTLATQARVRAQQAPLPASASRAATYTYAADVSVRDRAAIDAAVTAAGPDARRLIDEVDGLVVIETGPTGSDTIGLASGDGERYRITIDTARVAAHYPARALARVVLHEFGHVIDFALLDDAAVARLLAGVPQGADCGPGGTGGCDADVERFAESFAKWATGDIGVGLDIGYKVPPPELSLEAWGEPLSRLARELG